MSFVLPVLYHWSPLDRREKIARRGLRASTPTLTEVFAAQATGNRNLRKSEGTETVKAVCLGTSPSHAWALSGGIWGKKGSVWDLWQVNLDTSDCVRFMPNDEGSRLGEVRVCGNIPKGRVWHVGQRTIGVRKWSLV